jgi:predicted nucleic acid-binding protein
VRPKVYVETTIVSYLVARRTRNLIVGAHQELTRRWWRQRRRFEIFVSPLVIEEASRGDVAARSRRVRLLRDLALLEVNDDSRAVGRQLLAKGSLPAQAAGDALHIALAAVHGMEYLVTWNCRHIANAWMRSRIEQVIRGLGYEPPILCTPEELLEE